MKTLCYIVTISMLSGCSFGAYVDRLESGSRLQTTYKKDRYEDIRSGMHYAASATRPEAQPVAEPDAREVEASPRQAWAGWAK